MFMHSVSGCVASVMLQAAGLSVCVVTADVRALREIIPQRANGERTKRDAQSSRFSLKFLFALLILIKDIIQYSMLPKQVVLGLQKKYK